MRARGETLAMVLKALRENPKGLTTAQMHVETGIPKSILIVQLGNFRGAGHIESRPIVGGLIWSLDTGEKPAASLQLVTPRRQESVFASPTVGVSPQFALGTSRVMCEKPSGKGTYVAPDDFSPGAFMSDWRNRRSNGKSGAT